MNAAILEAAKGVLASDLRPFYGQALQAALTVQPNPSESTVCAVELMLTMEKARSHPYALSNYAQLAACVARMQMAAFDENQQQKAEKKRNPKGDQHEKHHNS